MRKFLIVAAITLIGYSAQAQSVSQSLLSVPASGTQALDTITNAGTVTMSSAVVKGTPNTSTITATFTKLTGTVAGVASLLGSVNGTDWASASSTTYTVTDVAAQTTSWQLTGSPYAYFRVSTVGSGTSTYTVKGQVFTRNPR